MRTITNISCIGAGLIGQGWATQFSSGGYQLVLCDVNDAILDRALVNINLNLVFLERHELLSKGAAVRSRTGYSIRPSIQMLPGCSCAINVDVAEDINNNTILKKLNRIIAVNAHGAGRIVRCKSKKGVEL